MENFSTEGGAMSVERIKSSATDGRASETRTQSKRERKRFLRSREQRYHHRDEFIDIEKNMISLVEKLKQRIDDCYYDVIISDEVGGRLPSLILKKVIDERGKAGPSSKRTQIFFLNFGRDVLDVEALNDFFKKTDLKDKHILLVTEAIEHGGTIKEAIHFLKDKGIDNVEIATVRSAGNQGGEFAHQGGIDEKGRWDGKMIVDDRNVAGKKVFSGQTYARQSPILDETGPILTGVEKEVRGGMITGAHPKKLGDIKSMGIPDYRSNKEARAYALKSIRNSGRKLQESVNMAREDVNTMSKVILRRVWKA